MGQKRAEIILLFMVEKLKLSSFLLVFTLFSDSVQAQNSANQGGGFPLWLFVIIGLLVSGAAGAIVFWLRSKQTRGRPIQPQNNLKKNAASKKVETSSPNVRRKADSRARPVSTELPAQSAAGKLTILPVTTFVDLQPLIPFEPMPHSDNPDLLTAIEQTDEFEDDADVRDLALRTLEAFKTSNSVEALSQMALYDLSSTLRSKAVSILADFDHETVFEPIVLAAADPSREVRAAAARSLFRLSFDRANAWTRIAESSDESRRLQIARAAVEAGIVERSIDRLAHRDERIAYEAYALVVLLIRAGEFAPIFKAIEQHLDGNIKGALLNIMRAERNPSVVAGLSKLLESGVVQTDTAKKIRHLISSFEKAAAG